MTESDPPLTMPQRRGINIRKRREGMGLSQAQLAEKAGTTQQTVDRLERGETEFSRALPKISAVLGMHIMSTSEESDSYKLVLATGRPEELPQKYRDFVEKHGRPAFAMDGRFIATLISSLEDALKFALSRKLQVEDPGLNEALFSESASLLNLEALAYLAQVVGIASPAERETLLVASEIRNLAVEHINSEAVDVPHLIDLAGVAVAKMERDRYTHSPESTLAQFASIITRLSMGYRAGGARRRPPDNTQTS